GVLRSGVPFKDLPAPPRESIGVHWDLVTEITPWQKVVRDALREGRWPLWNAHRGAGMPPLGDPQSQALQPLVLAALPLPLAQAVGVIAALRVLLAMIRMAPLLRPDSAR